MIYVRTPYDTHQYEALEQPIEFDHRHHVRDDGIPCLYCHSGAGKDRHAGIPATSVCMAVTRKSGPATHSWDLSARAIQGVPIPWKRIHQLPDFVYFHHGVHFQKGIAGAHCHGAIETTAPVYRVAPLTMDWCIVCHRHPPGTSSPNFGPVTALTTCTACHR
jgi:hypothetical protein